MFKRIIMYQGNDFNFFEAVFSWGSLYAFTMAQMMKELERVGIKYNLN